LKRDTKLGQRQKLIFVRIHEQFDQVGHLNTEVTEIILKGYQIFTNAFSGMFTKNE